jgi:hypothetical protein
MTTRITTLIAKRNALANELRHTRHGQFELQHKIDELTIEIGRLSAMPDIIGDLAPPALDMFAGLGTRRRRRRI